MQLTFGDIERDEPEWSDAWSNFTDPVMENHGEVLQYLGSELRLDGWAHIFRHRAHPFTDGHITLRFAASPGWEPRTVRTIGA